MNMLHHHRSTTKCFTRRHSHMVKWMMMTRAWRPGWRVVARNVTQWKSVDTNGIFILIRKFSWHFYGPEAIMNSWRNLLIIVWVRFSSSYNDVCWEPIYGCMLDISYEWFSFCGLIGKYVCHLSLPLWFHVLIYGMSITHVPLPLSI